MPDIERSQPILSPMTTAQKKKRFRELAQHDWRIRTARELAEELEQPFLPLFNEFKARVSGSTELAEVQANRAGTFRRTRRALEVGKKP